MLYRTLTIKRNNILDQQSLLLSKKICYADYKD